MKIRIEDRKDKCQIYKSNCCKFPICCVVFKAIGQGSAVFAWTLRELIYNVIEWKIWTMSHMAGSSKWRNPVRHKRRWLEKLLSLSWSINVPWKWKRDRSTVRLELFTLGVFWVSAAQRKLGNTCSAFPSNTPTLFSSAFSVVARISLPFRQLWEKLKAQKQKALSCSRTFKPAGNVFGLGPGNCSAVLHTRTDVASWGQQLWK